MDISAIKKSIRFSKIISFDLFDTLFFRPYLNPHDLFSHLEIIHNIPGFKNQRIIAEHNARFISKHEEVTLDEIYEHIESEFANIKLKEMELEYDSILINPDIKNLIDYSVSLNKKVIFISDMYLSADFIKSVFAKHLIKNFDSLYISSEHRLTKHIGKLFEKVVIDLKCDAKDILHIGDNKKSDIKIPRRYGFKTAYYPSYNDQFKRISSSNKSLLRLFNSYSSDFIQSYLLKQNINAKTVDVSKKADCFFWESIGFYYGSLIALSFYRNIANNYNPAKDELIFLGRDGFSIKLFFDNVKPQWNSHYIHLPRIFTKKCTFPLNINDDDNVHFLYELFNTDCSNRDITFRKNFILNNAEKYRDYAKNKKKFYAQYLKFKKVDINKRLIIVDSATMRFSAQELLSSISNNGVLGIYFYVRNITHKNYTYQSVYDYSHDNSGPSLEIKFILFVEFILASPESFIFDFDQKNFEPLYEEFSAEDKTRINIKASITSGLKRGSIVIKSIIGDSVYSVNTAFLMKNIQSFINFIGPEEAYFFKKINISTDFQHLEYAPLLSSDYSFFQTLLATRKTAKQLKILPYLNAPQLIAMMIRYPISIKSSSKKSYLSVYIFPFLNSNFFTLEFKIFNRFTISCYCGKRTICMEDQ